MAIGKIVDYEAEFSFDLISPETERPFGWSWRVVSGSSEKAKAAQKRVAAKNLAAQQGARKSKKTVSQFEAQITDNMAAMLELIAPCVVGWDASADLQKKHPTDDFEFSEKSLAEFLDVQWIFNQVNEAVNDIANFTQK